MKASSSNTNWSGHNGEVFGPLLVGLALAFTSPGKEAGPPDEDMKVDSFLSQRGVGLDESAPANP